MLSTAASDLLSLAKPRLSSLVLITAAGGICLAKGQLSSGRSLLMLLATAEMVAAANALNCYLERDSDRFMHRTKNRPLPSGRMEPSVALWFGIALAAISLPALAIGVNVLTALLGLTAFVSYVFWYTPMKPRSHWAMMIGALPGALPPLMGWTSVTGRLDLPGLVLFSIMFLWQLPHFLAIALYRKEEYIAAGLKSLPITHGDGASRFYIVVYLTALVPVTLLLYPLHVAGLLYLIVAALLGAAFWGLGFRGFIRKEGAPWARKLFFYSLIHCSGLFAALAVEGIAHG